MKKTYKFWQIAIFFAFVLVLACACRSGENGEKITPNDEDAVVTSIEIAVYPDTTEFFAGERFESDGLALRVIYSNGKRETVTEGFTCHVDTFEKSGYYPVKVSYGEKTLEYTVTVASSGLLFELMENECVLRGIGECTDTDVIIPRHYQNHSVTMIGGYAFEKNETLESIVIPEGVVCIADYAFAGCTALRRVDLPNSLETLTGSCFRGCSVLADIRLPMYVKQIGSYTFAECPMLPALVIPYSVTQMSVGVFDGSGTLQYIYCQALSAPAGWDAEWNLSDATVKWGNEWKYENDVPVLK